MADCLDDVATALEKIEGRLESITWILLAWFVFVVVLALFLLSRIFAVLAM